MQSQKMMYESARRNLAELNLHFMEMIKDENNPLTNDDLARLIKRNPAIWRRYEGFVGKLKD